MNIAQANVADRLSPTLQHSFYKPTTALNLELFKRINAAWHQRNHTEVNKLINIIGKAEMFIAVALELEKNHGKENVEDFWLLGLERYQRSMAYTEAYGFYLFRLGRFDKSLQHLKKCLDHTPSAAAIKIAIFCAFELYQYHLVWDYFSLFSAKERDNIEKEIVWQVATSALELEMYREAEAILRQQRDNLNIKAMPTLSQVISAQFSSEEEMNTWASSMYEKSKNKSEIEKTPLKDWLTLGSVLMMQDRFQDAYLMLNKVKKVTIAAVN